MFTLKTLNLNVILNLRVNLSVTLKIAGIIYFIQLLNSVLLLKCVFRNYRYNLFIFSEQANSSSTPSDQNTSIPRSCANHAVCLKWHAIPLAQIQKTVDRAHAPCENREFATGSRSMYIKYCSSLLTHLRES